MKKNIIYYVVFTITYLLLIVFTSPFLLTWGRKRGIIEQSYVWFLTKPFNLEISAGFILLNSLFWCSVFLIIFILVKKIIQLFN
jgi:hypothetical protein